MISNPFSRKPKSPIDQALDVLDGVRVEAAEAAATIRDAATQVADTLGDPPVPSGRRLPLLGVLAAAGLAIALVLKARAGRSESSTMAAPSASPPPSVATAAKATATPPPKQTTTPATEVEPEEPKDPKAETTESEAAAS